MSVNAEGSSIGGGEPRADQEAFDRACVARAHHNMRLSLIPIAMFVLTGVGTIARRRSEPL